jgi:hypothetical protein
MPRFAKFFLWGLVALVSAPVLAFVIWIGSAGFYELWNSKAYRYRLTVEIEDNGTVYTGSTVWEIFVQNKADWVPQSGGGHMRVRGQAVVVDMGAKGLVFVLLKENPEDYLSSPEYLVPKLIPIFDESTMMLEKAKHYASHRLAAEVPANRLPLMVRFRDINDPMTVERVNPITMSNVGQGVRLKRATIETVSSGLWPLNAIGLWGAPITTGIEARLPWLDQYYDQRLDGQRYGNLDSKNRFANSMSSGVFKTWR